MHQGPKLMTEPPTMGGRLTANSTEEALDPTSDPFSMPQAEMPQLLDHKNDTSADVPQFGTLPSDAPSLPPAAPAFTPPPASWTPPPAPSAIPPVPPAPTNADDRTLIELEEAVDSPHIKAESVDEARDEVEQALNNAPESVPEPIEALGAQQLGVDLHPSNNTGNSSSTDQPQVTDPTAPPPVPPPIPFQFGNPSPPQT
jgi:hypothetical protein